MKLTKIITTILLAVIGLSLILANVNPEIVDIFVGSLSIIGLWGFFIVTLVAVISIGFGEDNIGVMNNEKTTKNEKVEVLKDDLKQIKIENKAFLYLIRSLPIFLIIYVFFILANSLILFDLIYHKVNHMFPPDLVERALGLDLFGLFLTIAIILLLLAIPTHALRYISLKVSNYSIN